jgi:hypothetical protein
MSTANIEDAELLGKMNAPVKCHHYIVDAQIPLVCVNLESIPL